MAVSDGVFDEGTFDSATFNNVSRAETASLNEVDSFSFSTSKAESFTLSDSDIKEISDVLTVQVSAQDNFSREADYFRDFTQSIGLNDEEEFKFLTSFSEGLSVSESLSKLSASSLTETSTLSDGVEKDSQFFRTVQDSFGLSDVETVFVAKALTQTFSLDDEREEFFELVLAENATLQDNFLRQTDYVRSVSDSFSLFDATPESQVSRLVDLAESLQASDSVDTTGNLSRGIVEASTLSGSVSSEADLQRVLTDSYGLTDSSAKNLVKSLSQSYSVSDKDVVVSALLVADESLTLTDSAGSTSELFRDVGESLALSDSDIKEISQELGESFDASVTKSSEADLFRQVSDSVELQEQDLDIVLTKFIVESLKMQSSLSIQKSIVKVLNESLSLKDEQFITYPVDLTESFSLDSSLERLMDLNLDEQLSSDVNRVYRKLTDAFPSSVDIDKDGSANIDIRGD